MEIRQLPAVYKRVETGPVQFGDDWPGVFIRGDSAGYYALQLGRLLEDANDPFAPVILRQLQQVLACCIVGPAHAMFDPSPNTHRRD